MYRAEPVDAPILPLYGIDLLPVVGRVGEERITGRTGRGDRVLGMLLPVVVEGLCKGDP